MPRPARGRGHSTLPRFNSRYTDDDGESSSRYASPSSRRGEVRKGRSRASSVDSQDTYYDPRDRFYLSRDEEKKDHAPRRGRAPRYSRHGRDPSPLSDTSSRASSPERGYHSSSHGSQSTSRPSSPSYDSYSPRSSVVRGRDGRRHRDRYEDDHRVRPRDLHRDIDRDRPKGRESHSSSSAAAWQPPRHRNRRARSTSRSPSRSRNSNPKSSKTLAQEVLNHALEAGAMAALRLRNDPAPWLGAHKGGQIAAAALSAALVDTLVARGAPGGMRKGGLRHAVAGRAMQMIITGLVKADHGGGAKGKGWKGGKARR